jgi:hypothetical protein
MAIGGGSDGGKLARKSGSWAAALQKNGPGGRYNGKAKRARYAEKYYDGAGC